MPPVTRRSAAAALAASTPSPPQRVVRQPPPRRRSRMDTSARIGDIFDVTFRQVDMTSVDTDVLVASCNDECRMPNGLFKAIGRRAGMERFKVVVGEAVKALPNGARHSGQVVCVDMSSTAYPTKYLFLVIKPDNFHNKMAWTGVFTRALDLNCTSICVPGLGCGAQGLTSQSSATKMISVWKDLLDNNKWTAQSALKSVIVCDLHMTVVRMFDRIVRQTFDLGGETALSQAAPGAANAYVVKCLQVDADESCVICMDTLVGSVEVVELIVCKHQFHAPCFELFLQNGQQKSCPTCKKFFALPMGDMPTGGRMSHQVMATNMPLEGGHGAIQIHYDVPSGVQASNHPRPGVPFHGTSRTAYLPNTDEGRLVLRLLEKAFECRLTFTVGDSVTTGAKNVVVWNNIHHKTSLNGGSTNFGYPDPDYLNRVTDELRAAGITQDML